MVLVTRLSGAGGKPCITSVSPAARRSAANAAWMPMAVRSVACRNQLQADLLREAGAVMDTGSAFIVVIPGAGFQASARRCRGIVRAAATSLSWLSPTFLVAVASL
ncbi:hypothetical protein D3C81_1723790 [compost metagenome]